VGLDWIGAPELGRCLREGGMVGEERECTSISTAVCEVIHAFTDVAFAWSFTKVMGQLVFSLQTHSIFSSPVHASIAQAIPYTSKKADAKAMSSIPLLFLQNSRDFICKRTKLIPHKSSHHQLHPLFPDDRIPCIIHCLIVSKIDALKGGWDSWFLR
jgi:hypothetical protein